MQQFLAALLPVSSISGNFFLADLFDVLIIALFVYAVLLLFKQTHSVSILFGIITIIILYIFAQTFELYLTSLFLQAFFGVFFIILAIVFQEELRRFFEIISLWNARGRNNGDRTLTSPTILAIIQAITELSRHKIGALIVVSGRENIDRHIEGGEHIDGLLSSQLLESLFDPSSSGHDGAVIVKRNRVSTFGAHLPLSHNFDQIGKRGTRHSAALGISENTDSLAIVVSEEQGTISVALNGQLKELTSAADLEQHISDFIKEMYPGHLSMSMWETIIKKNSFEKLVALGMAGVLWFVLAFQADTVQRNFELPITYRNLGETLVLENSNPSKVTVTLSSRGNTFDTLDPQTLGVSIDAANLETGSKRIRITDDMIRRPLNYSVANITPSEIEITITKYTSVSLPIEAVTTGAPAQGFVVDRVEIIPGQISILIPETESVPKSIQTEPIVIDGITKTLEAVQILNLPDNFRLGKNASSNVTLKIIIKKK